VALTTMKLTEMRELTDAELRTKLAEYEKERAALRFKAGTEVLPNPMDLRTARRTVARLKTVMAERARTKKAG